MATVVLVGIAVVVPVVGIAASGSLPPLAAEPVGAEACSHRVPALAPGVPAPPQPSSLLDPGMLFVSLLPPSLPGQPFFSLP